MMYKNFSTAEQLRGALFKKYSSILPEITPYSFKTINRVIKGMDHTHRVWPIILAAASGGELAARKLADEYGWLQKAAA